MEGYREGSGGGCLGNSRDPGGHNGGMGPAAARRGQLGGVFGQENLQPLVPSDGQVKSDLFLVQHLGIQASPYIPAFLSSSSLLFL